jgi:hypothetical protein
MAFDNCFVSGRHVDTDAATINGILVGLEDLTSHENKKTCMNR